MTDEEMIRLWKKTHKVTQCPTIQNHTRASRVRPKHTGVVRHTKTMYSQEEKAMMVRENKIHNYKKLQIKLLKDK